MVERALIPFVFVRLADRYRFREINDPASPAAAANGQYLANSARCLRRCRRPSRNRG